MSHLIVEADWTEFRRTVTPSWNLRTRRINPRKLKLNSAKNASACCSIRRIPLFSLMGTNFAVSAMSEYRLNKPNFALATLLNLFYKNPGEMQNKKGLQGTTKLKMGSAAASRQARETQSH